jgi:hypothetical protein
MDDTRAPNDTADTADGRGRGSWPLPTLLLALVLIVGLGAIALTVARDSQDAAHDPVGDSIKASRYQVVVLSDDKLYFGHLKALGHGWYRLDKAHYLRQKAGSDPKKSADLQVAPVSDQKVPGTDDTMLLRGESIVQVQNLVRDSAVETAIRNLRQ